MIASVHLADLSQRDAVRALRSTPTPATAPGLRYADVTLGAALSASLVPRPDPGRVGLVAVWQDDAALDRFLADAPLAGLLRDGWHTRLEPLRATTNGITGMPSLVDAERPVDEGEPVAVLTYGRLNLRAMHHFLRSSARAEGEAVEHPALLAGTALARPPRLVATFSLWRSAGEMREYAYRGSGHTAAMRDMDRRHFHREWLFARFRPYGATGRWDGREPLSAPPGARAPGGGRVP